MVSQDNVLFPGTVRENIRYGRLEADDGEVVEAARLAQAEEFIEKFPLGYDTPIGERGLMLSGGQRQRLALARVVLRRPRILILDEATSALDAESEQLVQRALATILHRQTTFVVAHRLSTIRHADRIIVLDGGVIAEQGAHRALLARRGSLYRKLHEILEDGTRRS
jgi:ABC-type multidrug transport system fused ATPase/permease subunit